MVQIGEQAPEFTVPKAGGDAYNDLGEGPVVLVFVPAAFTSACTEELCTFRDSLARFATLGARVYGVSVDLPFAQNIWIREQDLILTAISP
ncbi:MAG: redoxin domain-containing protein [Haloarculaceae archaeon]